MVPDTVPESLRSHEKTGVWYANCSEVVMGNVPRRIAGRVVDSNIRILLAENSVAKQQVAQAILKEFGFGADMVVTDRDAVVAFGANRMRQGLNLPLDRRVL